MFIPHQHRRQKMRKLLLVFCSLFLLSVFGYSLISTTSLLTSPAPQDPNKVVEQFYAYEQSGDFGSAWELFHPLMKEKFTKQSYIHTRARVFLQDFGVETFEVEIGKFVLEPSWKMSPTSSPLSNVQMVPVTLVYHSIFGNLKIEQEVYVAKDDELQYGILWPFSK